MSEKGVELKFTVLRSRCPQILEFDHFTFIDGLYITAIIGVCE